MWRASYVVPVCNCYGADVKKANLIISKLGDIVCELAGPKGVKLNVTRFDNMTRVKFSVYK